uniref:Uncharacterized protein n=1 Tax=Rhizophora mucronata TaxID=61149 RepID=A0A2P2MUN0_RHIMU
MELVLLNIFNIHLVPREM